MHDSGGRALKDCLALEGQLERGEKGEAQNLCALAADGIYRGLIYSDGVTDQGLKIVPNYGGGTQNALSMFKQCLFRIEIQ
jgi:hypothetical protein